MKIKLTHFLFNSLPILGIFYLLVNNNKYIIIQHMFENVYFMYSLLVFVSIVYYVTFFYDMFIYKVISIGLNVIFGNIFYKIYLLEVSFLDEIRFRFGISIRRIWTESELKTYLLEKIYNNNLSFSVDNINSILKKSNTINQINSNYNKLVEEKASTIPVIEEKSNFIIVDLFEKHPYICIAIVTGIIAVGCYVIYFYNNTHSISLKNIETQTENSIILPVPNEDNVYKVGKIYSKFIDDPKNLPFLDYFIKTFFQDSRLISRFKDRTEMLNNRFPLGGRMWGETSYHISEKLLDCLELSIFKDLLNFSYKIIDSGIRDGNYPVMFKGTSGEKEVILYALLHYYSTFKRIISEGIGSFAFDTYTHSEKYNFSLFLRVLYDTVSGSINSLKLAQSFINVSTESVLGGRTGEYVDYIKNKAGTIVHQRRF